MSNNVLEKIKTDELQALQKNSCFSRDSSLGQACIQSFMSILLLESVLQEDRGRVWGELTFEDPLFRQDERRWSIR